MGWSPVGDWCNITSTRACRPKVGQWTYTKYARFGGTSSSPLVAYWEDWSWTTHPTRRSGETNKDRTNPTPPYLPLGDYPVLCVRTKDRESSSRERVKSDWFLPQACPWRRINREEVIRIDGKTKQGERGGDDYKGRDWESVSLIVCFRTSGLCRVTDKKILFQNNLGSVRINKYII